MYQIELQSKSISVCLTVRDLQAEEQQLGYGISLQGPIHDHIQDERNVLSIQAQKKGLVFLSVMY